MLSRCATSATLGLCVLAMAFAAGGRAGEPAPAAPPPPPASAADREPRLPPIPNEAEVMEAVFATLPDVDPREVLEFIAAEFPAELYRFKTALMRKPEEAVELFTSLVGESLELMRARRGDPERFAKLMRERELERKAARLAETVRAADGAARAGAAEELRRTLTEAFEIRQELMQADVRQLAAELHKLRQLVEARDRNRESIIAQRVGQMSGDLDQFVW
ncbi:MAG: hypothetical protein FJ225_03100 [Lentisphaerae bacterium]|nr:hypothetical protein [Lentisphaerota bacterium]